MNPRRPSSSPGPSSWANACHLTREAGAVRNGGWQTSLGANLRGKCLGVLGLGNIGKEVAGIGLAFGMTVIAWSQNLTAEIASAAGATLVAKRALFRQADVVTIDLILSRRPDCRSGGADRGAAGAQDRRARARSVRCRALACGSSLSDVMATPHIGFVTEELYRTFYGDAAASIAAWLDTNAA
jgi:phosphoglycerate dehydrogenase-like enzyme